MPARLHRWDEIALDKITELMSQKIVAGTHQMLAQTYLKQGALVPMHAHASEQMTYVLQGALKFRVEGEEIIVREGEVIHIPANAAHQAEALEDTFQLDIFSPPREDWLREAEPDPRSGRSGRWVRCGARPTSPEARSPKAEANGTPLSNTPASRSRHPR